MTNPTSSTYFKQLTNKEKVSKLLSIAREKGEVTIWEKGGSARRSTPTQYFDRKEYHLHLDLKRSSLVDKEILYSFKLTGLSFFGKGKLIEVGKELAIECRQDLFKTERRKNFRLLTYPAHSVFAAFKLEGYAEQSNVISMQTKMSQTGLFNKFLNLIEDQDDNKFETGYVPIRVQDISVTGLAIMIGEIEKEFFQTRSKTGPIFIDLGDEPVKVEDSEVVYAVESIPGISNSRTYKVGIKFLDVSEDVDGKLSSRINSLIRVREDKEFEEFIK